MQMSKLVFYSCLVFGAVAGITGIALLSGDKTLAQNPQGQGQGPPPSRVIVTNTPLPVQATNPLPVTVTNQPAPAAVTPFHGQCASANITMDHASCSIPIMGKLVVQAVSVAVSVVGPATPAITQIQEMTGTTVVVFHDFPLSPQFKTTGAGTFIGLQPLTWILDSTATAVQCSTLLDSAPLGAGQMFCNVCDRVFTVTPAGSRF